MRALIVDDEPLARAELRTLLEAAGGVTVVAECENAIEALKAARRERPDVLFLDVQMPVVDGFELLGMLDPDDAPAVVFVSAHDAFALRAFEESAADYLLKPVAGARLAKTLERLRSRPRPEATAALASPLARVPCLAGKAIKLVPLAEIEVIHSSAAGVFVVAGPGELLTELTLKVLEERSGFLRCHKQHLVNPDRVDEIRLGDDPDGPVLRTRSGHQVPVSRRHLAAVRARLGV